MRKIIIVAGLSLAVAGCTNYRVAKQCNDENPMPGSYTAGSFFGLLGIGAAYATDGDAISQVTQKRQACFDERKAAAAAN